MTAAPVPAPEAAASTHTLPPLPNPTLRAGGPLLPAAQDGLRALRTLYDGALNGTVDYPYPPTADYPLPPLPPIPLPLGVRRTRRTETTKPERPNPLPPIPPTSPLLAADSLASLVAAHNKANPTMPASLHFGDGALLVRLGERGWVWALLRALGGEGVGTGVMGVRFFPARDTTPPPIHASQPPGPAQVLAEHLASLNLTAQTLLFRLPHILALLDAPCFLCGRHLNDLDGLPLGATGFLAPPPVRKGSGDEAAAAVNGHKEDKGGETKESKESQESKAEKEKKEQKDKTNKEGRWVAWHPSCEPA